MKQQANTDLRRSSRVRKAAAIILPVIAVGVLYWSYASTRPTQPRAGSFYAYNPQTKSILVVNLSDPRLASGQVVLAHVFSSGRCADESERVVGYLERSIPSDGQGPTANMAAVSGKDGSDGPVAPRASGRAKMPPMTQGQVSKPDAPDQWVTDTSPEASQIRQGAFTGRDGKPVHECFPDRD